MLYPYIIFSLVFSALTVYLQGVSGIGIVLYGILYIILYLVAAVLLHLLVLWLMSLPVDKEKPETKDSPAYRRMTAFTIGAALRLMNVHVRVTGLEKIPEGRFLLVGNHRSGFDPLITLCALDKYQLGFITKPENMAIPVVGKFAHKICALPIDRDNPRNAVKTINAAAELIENDVVSVAIYPEGTRNRGEGLLPFKHGSFKIACKAGVPIVIACMKNSEVVMRKPFFKRAEVELEICEVIPAETVKASSTAVLSEYTRKVLCASLGVPYEEETHD